MTHPIDYSAEIAALRADLGELQAQFASFAALVSTIATRAPELESQIAELRLASHFHAETLAQCLDAVEDQLFALKD